MKKVPSLSQATSLFRTVLAVLFFAISRHALGETATKALRSFLKEQNYKQGFNPDTGEYIFIGDSSSRIPNLIIPDFLQIREQLALAATLAAKRRIINTLCSDVSGGDSTEIIGDDTSTTQTTTSIVDIFSKRILHGCTILHTAESYDNGLYSFAVAVVWSGKLEKAARAALVGDGTKTTPEQDEAEWAAWAARTDFAKRIGPAQFTDAYGVYRYAGIGCVDIEGVTGQAFLNAKRGAEKKAEQSLVYSLWADTVAHDHAVTILREQTSSKGNKTELIEDFLSRIQQACTQHVLKRKVFTGKFVHPLTGRKMFVYVAGIDPSKLAELKILESMGNE